MKRRVKFVWGASRVIRGRWVLGLFGRYDRAEGFHEDGLAISVRGVLAWGAAFSVVAYLAAATALYFWWQRNPYSFLSYTDAVFYPVRRAQISDKHGQAYIEQGLDYFRHQKYVDAKTLLQMGLARHPHDFRARLALAQFYALANQRAAAWRILEDGLTAEYPGRPYLDALCKAAEQGEDYGRVVQVADRYLPALAGDAGLRDRRWLTGRKFGALMAAGRYEEAFVLTQTDPAGDLAAERRVLALLALKRPQEALEFLAEWAKRPAADQRTVTRLEIRADREAGKFEAMDAALGRLHQQSPADPAPLVYGIVQRALAGRQAQAKQAFEDYLFRFGGTPENLVLAMEPLAEIGDLSLVQRCADAARERGYRNERFDVLLVQTLIQQQQFARARAIIVAMSTAAPASTRLWQEWMLRLIDVATSASDAADTAMVEFLRDRPWPTSVYRRTVEVLVQAQRLEAARDTIAVGIHSLPASAWLQQQRDDVNRRLAARAAALAATAPPAKGAPAENAFMADLDTAMKAGRWADVERRLREINALQPVPEWAQMHDVTLRLAQLRLDHAQANRLAMANTARVFLNRDERRAAQLIEVAWEYYRANDRDAAIVLLGEIRRGLPNYAPAKKLLADWQPQAGK